MVGLRVIELVLSLVAVTVLLAVGAGSEYVPLVLAGCTVARGVAVRQLLLVRGTEVTDGARQTDS